ncbi:MULTISPECIES: GNAT family N-acetyltransferase [unclassified Paenibacillus]|uniref:GNAT family N-acetyltransferase n=1 Tax=unclassified Paenibacillus TaxID=185978 RepID=UPI00277F95CA|nr:MULTISPECIES: GNAT family N-acetyltransferase [unclassified Paenibacillus]MDQ0901220.1 GNAT superfamily N-acetyltransferase [Paenibacillus sp. V4I7]MDQ0920283.1 GNAT superfamily N-acetyltransferase [Paenibacillus sp. V4I5]
MSASVIQIREARAEDRGVIRQLLAEAYGQYQSVLSPEGWELYKENILASVDGDAPTARIVAEVDGEIVGSSLLYHSSEVAYGLPELNIQTPIIRLLAVSPQARGKGIATELIKESARRALELGATTLHLHTSDMMESAVKLYERLGFERAFDKDIQKGDVVVKSYRLHLKETAILR